MEGEILEFLNPRYVDFDYASGFDVEVSGDIDSFLVCSYTMEPFLCRYNYVINTKIGRIMRSQNTKLTMYMNKRKDFGLRLQRDFEPVSDTITRNGVWYEFELGKIDNRQLFVVFQIDEKCRFLRDCPVRSTYEEEGRLKECVSAFVSKFIARAARLLDKNCETARGGFRYIMHDVDRSYNVMSKDYYNFCRLLSNVIRTKSLRKSCGMTCVRFYQAQHGLRLEKAMVENLLKEVVDVQHPYMDILQIHRADTMSCPDGDVLLIKLDGREDDSLLGMFRNSINIIGRIDRYRTGFLSNYGYFRRHASPNINNYTVTYVQAYSSGAKMARPSDSGYIESYVVCRGYAEESKFVRKFAENTK